MPKILVNTSFAVRFAPGSARRTFNRGVHSVTSEELNNWFMRGCLREGRFSVVPEELKPKVDQSDPGALAPDTSEVDQPDPGALAPDTSEVDQPDPGALEVDLRDPGALEVDLRDPEAPEVDLRDPEALAPETVPAEVASPEPKPTRRGRK